MLWGRRRVGKTSLVWEFSQHKPSLFFFSERASSAYLLREFSKKVQALLLPEDAENIDPEFSYSDWYTAFQQLEQLTADRRIVVVIDEFPYLVQSVPGIATSLQKAWDLHLSKSKICLVLTGSTLSVMNHQVLDSSAPLYGRHTWALELKPLLIYDLPPFLPKYSATQLIETYAVLGGLPGYVLRFSDRTSVLNNIARQIVSVSGSLFGAAQLNIFEEIADPKLHISILGVIANGIHKPADIGRLAAIRDRHQLHRILRLLQEVGLVEARTPLARDRGEN